MPSLSVFGAQWGDEGKGKIIDKLAHEQDLVVRYQGGANAGHTVVVEGTKFVLHHLPSGILHSGKRNVIAGGMAVDPETLVQEIDAITERGFPIGPENLAVSGAAHVIFPHHRRIDHLSEVWKGDGRIGTTGRGIGPCYADKSARTGLRIADLLNGERLRERLTASLAEKNALLEKVHGESPLDLEEEISRAAGLGERIAPFVADTGAMVRKAYADGQQVLFEGAQGVMLDVDHGTYPFVTSSNTGVHGIGPGVGFPPSRIDRAYGIAKAYCTRVGEGPFPSEDHGEGGERLRELGHEFGATTGRPRRCGWLDAVAIRYALEISGADGWILTKLDVLDAFEEIQVAVAYEIDGVRHETYPAAVSSIENVKPVYTTRRGWRTDLTAVRRFEDLPEAAQDYVRWLEREVGVPIVLISVGPERDQVIPRQG
ncbi:MAG: adenylosuccinate synthase [Planctomycetota bacterium]